MIGIHAKPDHAVEEIGALLDVYNDVRQTWRDVEVYILLVRILSVLSHFKHVLTIPLKYKYSLYSSQRVSILYLKHVVITLPGVTS